MQKSDYDFLMKIYKRYQILKDIDINLANDYLSQSVDPNLWIDFCKMKQNRKKRNRTIRKRIEKIIQLNPNCAYFATLTISPEYYSENLVLWRKRAKNALKGAVYVGNFDFGEKNERLHLHFVVNKCDISWKYGFFCFKKINSNSLQLARYLNKLTNHSTKLSAQRIIFSNNLK